MSLILNIDTSTEKASICLAQHGEVISLLENHQQKDHASWIHPAIDQLLYLSNCSMPQLQAVAITAGPGSYTGLRVGMATAKGLCFALNIPFITENTLRVMALATKEAYADKSNAQNILFCPMIDARRMEVFTSLFTPDLEEKLESAAIVLEKDTFSEYLSRYQVIFSGNGSAKFKGLVFHSNAEFSDIQFSATQLAVLSYRKFNQKEFTDVAYAEPIYLKEFYTAGKK